MNACSCSTEAETAAQRRVISVALTLNALMFLVGFVAGIIAQSSGLIADSLDMLADALAYSVGLYAIGQTQLFKSRAATVSGCILVVLGCGVLLDVARRAVFGASPEGRIMLAIAALSLLVNSVVLYLLTRYRDKEVNLRATWICTRADVVANASVIFSAICIWLTGWRYIDLIIGAAIGIYVLKGAFEILGTARAVRLQFASRSTRRSLPKMKPTL